MTIEKPLKCIKCQATEFIETGCYFVCNECGEQYDKNN